MNMNDIEAIELIDDGIPTRIKELCEMYVRGWKSLCPDALTWMHAHGLVKITLKKDCIFKHEERIE